MSPRHAPWAEAPPDFAIGLRPIAEEAWLEGGGDLSVKDGLLAAHPSLVWGESAASRPAQAEAAALIERAIGVPVGEGPPLWAASRLVADDLCLMEKRDGQWRLTAASLCSPTFFTVEDALGRSLRELHGPVPAFAERFLGRLERIFDHLRPGHILERRNWTLVNSGELFLPSAAPVRAAIDAIAPDRAAQALFLRVERQTLRALSEGRALFTIRIWRDPLIALRQTPDLMARFEQAWRGASPAFRDYKGLHRYDALVEAFLAGA